MQAKSPIDRLRDVAAGIRHTAAGLTRLQVWVIALLVGLIAIGGVVSYVRARPREIKVNEGAGAAAGRKRELTVHVAGAVLKPGLYKLPEGSRVDDALSKAGGAAPDALLDDVNLAAKLNDGQKILVSKAAGGASTPVGAAAGADLSGGPGKLVNINTASEAELDTLPGVGPSMAGKIVEYRTKNGTFSSIEDLDSVEGIGPKKLEALKDLVTF